jgi:hypothetical protein
MRWRPGPRAAIVLRTLVLADGVLLAVLGGLALAYVQHPGGVYLAAGLWLASAIVFGLLPLTDPYRRDRHRSTW